MKKNLLVSLELIKATKCMLKELRSFKFYSVYDQDERKKSRNDVLNLFNETLENIKENHPEGEKLYSVLYFSYFITQKLSREEICNRISTRYCNGPLTVSTYYRWQNDAVEIFAYTLWSNPEFSELVLYYFQDDDLRKNYDKLCLEHLSIKNSKKIGYILG